MASLDRRSVGKRLVVALAAVGALTGYVLSGWSPDYRSEARIQVVPQRIADDIVRSPATGHLADRVAALKQSILTRTRLERLILDFNLFARERQSGMIMQEVIELMVRNISIAVDTSRFGDVASVLVSYTAKEPMAAQKVAEQLAGFLITESLKESERRAATTSDFLEAQIADTGARLAAHDERMAAARVAGGRDSARMQLEAEVMRNSYKALLEKREQALMRVRIERSQNGENFFLIEQARLPQRPEGPTRRAASVAGALAGLAVGLVVTMFLAIRRALTRALLARAVDAKTGV